MTAIDQDEQRRLWQIETELTAAAKTHGVSPLRLAVMVIQRLEARMPTFRHVAEERQGPAERVLGTND